MASSETVPQCSWNLDASPLMYLHFLTRFSNKIFSQSGGSREMVRGMVAGNDFLSLEFAWNCGHPCSNRLFVSTFILTLSTQNLYFNAFMRLPFTTRNTKIFKKKKILSKRFLISFLVPLSTFVLRLFVYRRVCGSFDKCLSQCGYQLRLRIQSGSIKSNSPLSCCCYFVMWHNPQSSHLHRRFVLSFSCRAIAFSIRLRQSREKNFSSVCVCILASETSRVTCGMIF